MPCSEISVVTHPRPHWRQQSLHSWFGWFRWARWAPSAVSVYYPNPQIDPVRNAVSSSEQASLLQLQLSTHPESPARWQAHRESVCNVGVCAGIYAPTHPHTHTAWSRRREGSEELLVLLSLSPTCQQMCDPTLQTSVLLMWNVHKGFLSSLPFSLHPLAYLSPPASLSLGAASYICSIQCVKWLQVFFFFLVVVTSVCWLSLFPLPSVPHPLSLFVNPSRRRSTPNSRPTWEVRQKICL